MLSKQEVIDLMLSSESEKEWDENADLVKATNNGEYPGWWFSMIVIGGVSRKAKESHKW